MFVIVSLLLIAMLVFFERSRMGQSAHVTIPYQMVRAATKAGTVYQYPLVTGYPDKEVVERVNGVLKEKFEQEIGCLVSKTDKDDIENISIAIDYADKDLLSIYVQQDLQCSGAMLRQGGFEALNFDMKLGKQISFSGLFKNYDRDKDAILSIIYGRAIKAAAAYKASPRHSEEEGCEGGNDLEMLHSYGHIFRVKAGRFYAIPNYPFALAACFIEAEMPMEALGPYRVDGGLLDRF